MSDRLFMLLSLYPSILLVGSKSSSLPILLLSFYQYLLVHLDSFCLLLPHHFFFLYLTYCCFFTKVICVLRLLVWVPGRLTVQPIITNTKARTNGKNNILFFQNIHLLNYLLLSFFIKANF